MKGAIQIHLPCLTGHGQYIINIDIQGNNQPVCEGVLAVIQKL